MENINILAIDLAKQTFHLRGVNHKGKAMLNRKVSREMLMESVRKVSTSARIAMEACGTAHYWGRKFKSAGYKVDLIAPQYVKPYVKSQKNDSADAEAIAEAASRDSMRFVPVKSIEQQDIQCLHRVRERYIKTRTALMNELRGLLMEYGFVIPKGRPALSNHASLIFESEEVSATMKSLSRELYAELLELEVRLAEVTKRIESIAKSLDVCKRLMTIPGIAAISSTALYAAVAHMNFKKGRELAAFLGLVPRQYSTGGKMVLGSITKRGDTYVRKQLVHGARSVLQNAHRHGDRYSSWAKMMRDTKGYTKGAVAVANRNARVAWAIMYSDSTFDRDFVPATKAQRSKVLH